MSHYSEYKKYIVDSLTDVMSKQHIDQLKERLSFGIETSDELYDRYNELYELHSKEELMNFKTWFRDQRLKKLFK